MKKILHLTLLFLFSGFLQAQLSAPNLSVSGDIIVQPELQSLYYQIQNDNAGTTNIGMNTTVVSQSNPDSNIEFQMCIEVPGGFGICLPGLSVQSFPVPTGPVDIGINFLNASVENTIVLDMNIFVVQNPSDEINVEVTVNVTNTLNIEVAQVRVLPMGNAYPNPSNGIVNIPMHISDFNSTLAVMDISGKQVYSTRLQGGIYTRTYDFSHLPKGIYILAIKNESAILRTQKLVLR
ncbi:MAG: T9SS type A sorting domain-containing protein [Luteibaculaceae bacterium]